MPYVTQLQLVMEGNLKWQISTKENLRKTIKSWKSISWYMVLNSFPQFLLKASVFQPTVFHFDIFFAETADGLGWNEPVRLRRTGRCFGDSGPGWKGWNEAKSSEIIQKSTPRDEKMRPDIITSMKIKKYLRLVSQQAAKWVSLRKCQTPVPWNGKQPFSLWQVVSRYRPARDVLGRNRTSRSQGQQKETEDV